MKLYNLIKNIKHEIMVGSDCDILNLTIDSRKVTENSLFACIIGLTSDGHDFISSAAKSGAVAILVSKEIKNIPEGVTVIKVDDTRDSLSYIAANFYDNPEKQLNLIGITGTNGKTSTTYFVESILQEWGKRVGVIGTINARIGDENLDIKFATSTTPDTIELMQIFAKMKQKETSDVVMEVSSHALELKKVNGIKFSVGVFTNLTQDHLDFHGTLENYKKTKSRLFKMCDACVINIDDEYSDYMRNSAACKVMTYSINKTSDLKAENIVYTSSGVVFSIKYNGAVETISMPIPGRFTVYNSLAAIGTAITLGVPIEIIKKGLNNLKTVPGRIQSIPNDKGFNVIVDYSHTPDGLENIIKAVREFTKGKVITIFGCGGERDRAKRPIMGEIAGHLSDYVIVTSDNPRTENPEFILDEIEVGILKTGTHYVKMVNRKEAIYEAVKIAKHDDCVIIAGKGHESYQIFADKTIHFDDVEVATEAILALD